MTVMEIFRWTGFCRELSGKRSCWDLSANDLVWTCLGLGSSRTYSWWHVLADDRHGNILFGKASAENSQGGELRYFDQWPRLDMLRSRIVTEIFLMKCFGQWPSWKYSVWTGFSRALSGNRPYWDIPANDSVWTCFGQDRPEIFLMQCFSQWPSRKYSVWTGFSQELSGKRSCWDISTTTAFGHASVKVVTEMFLMQCFSQWPSGKYSVWTGLGREFSGKHSCWDISANDHVIWTNSFR